VVDVFTQDKVFSGFQWAAMGAGMIPPGTEDKYMVVVPPGYRMEDGSVRRIYSIGGQPWVINAFNDEAHMRVALDFLTWWYLPETQLAFAEGGGNPATAAAMNAEGFEDINVWNRAYKDMLTEATARDFWHEPTYSEMLAIQQEGWTAYASGQVNDAANTLNWIACQQQEILYDAGRTMTDAPAECENINLE
jgi:multiple sugar transport system substrate-binding protein